MLYNDALQFLYGLTNYETRAPADVNNALKLDRMRALLAALGNPHEQYKIIHVAGTKGKGSTCAMLESCLRHSGIKTGLYTSPHLSTFRERARVNGEIMAPEIAGLLAEKVRDAMTDIPGITAFEAITALALLHFAREGVEWAVIEVGLGGRLDATNVVSPRACVLTSISYDHMTWLGDSLTLIAGEKAGIIKPGVPVISQQQLPEAATVIERIARENNAPLIQIGRHWRWTPGAAGLGGQEFEIKEVARIRSREHPFVSDLEGRYQISLLGRHQAENAAAVIATLNTLREELTASGAKEFGAKAVKAGLRAAVWAGRFEVLRAEPPVILDGAHNVDSANKLAMTLVELFPGRRWTFVFATYRDKMASGMLKALNPRAARWIFTEVPNSPRTTPAAELLEAGRALNVRSPVALADLTEALALAVAGNDAVCIFGSVALAGETRIRWSMHTGETIPVTDRPLPAHMAQTPARN